MTPDRLRNGRRAIVLLVRGQVGEEIDRVRRRWDPVMAGRIDPHVTLIHDAIGADVAERVAELAARTPPIELRLMGTARWAGTSAYGVYLRVEDPTGAVAKLQGALADLETPRWARAEYRAHLTLVHGRSVDPAEAEPAWAALRGWRLDRAVAITALDVIELDDAIGWTAVQRSELRG